MFDGSLPEMGAAAGLSDGAVVEAVRGWKRVEAAAAARKVAMMAELFVRRTRLGVGERELWWVDPQASVAAELAAAAQMTASMAVHQTHRGVALRDRLPMVAALFAAGVVSDLVVRAIVWRTYLITDAAAMAAVDAALAARVGGWAALSIVKTEEAIDALVDEHDPGALRRAREAASAPGVEFGSPGDVAGTTSMWARLYAGDAAVIQARVEQMAHSVCPDDRRGVDERRAAALRALAEGRELGCGCGRSDCPGAVIEGPAPDTVVYVIADEQSVAAARPDTTTPQPPADPEPSDRDSAGPPAYVLGGGVLPTALLGPVVARARLRVLGHPGAAPAEARYVPSTALREFVRCRDLRCRFPHCDKPAQLCDVDHTVAWPVGPTHPSNLKCLCRFHHLLKTFWCGPAGWRDRQLPDGTGIWTSPTGHTYPTYPGSRWLFPSLCAPTATLWTGEPPTIEPSPGRAARMPKRRYTRAHTEAKAITAERRLNDAHVAERNKPPPF